MNNSWKLRLAIVAITSALGCSAREEQVAVAAKPRGDEATPPVAKPVSAPAAPVPATAPAPTPTVAAAPKTEPAPAAGENASAANEMLKAADNSSKANAGPDPATGASSPLPYAPAPPANSTAGSTPPPYSMPAAPANSTAGSTPPPYSMPAAPANSTASSTMPPYSMPAAPANSTAGSTMPPYSMPAAAPTTTPSTMPPYTMPPVAGNPQPAMPAMPGMQTNTPPAGAPANPQGAAPGAIGTPAMRNLNKSFAAGKKAAEDFIAAATARDSNAVLNATALRSKTESSEINRVLFEAILDEKLTDDDLTKLSEMFSDYKVVNILNANSVGRLLIIVDKTSKTESYQRTITVRKEAAGWRVLDFSNRRNFGLSRGLRPGKAAKK